MDLLKCNLCESNDLTPIIDLGFHPCADTFIESNRKAAPEVRYPLVVNLCKSCGHAQLSYEVPPTRRYQEVDYSYDSSNSPVSIKHFHELAQEVCELYNLSENDLVCDVGSNVGTLLESFKNIRGCKVLGIDPSLNISKIANQNGIETINNFFCREVVDQIINERKVKVITATNILNHTKDVSDFFLNAEMLLDEDGVVVIENPYMYELINQLAFDTIYLEHINYFSVAPLSRFLTSIDWGIENIQVSDYMCGTIRIFMKPRAKHSEIVNKFISMEVNKGLYEQKIYLEFMKKIKKLKISLNEKIYKILSENGKIIGIGAATKGNTLLNFCNLDGSTISYITDASRLKIGKITPGSHIPIKADEMISDEITHALILPWNIASYLENKLSYLGLEFISFNTGEEK